jgi:hypothetical protein
MIPISRDFQEFFRLLNDQGIEYLIVNKKASGRPKDLADVDALSKRQLQSLSLWKMRP